MQYRYVFCINRNVLNVQIYVEDVLVQTLEIVLTVQMGHDGMQYIWNVFLVPRLWDIKEINNHLMNVKKSVVMVIFGIIKRIDVMMVTE